MLIEILKNRTEGELVLLSFVLGVFILFAGVKVGQLIGIAIKALS